MIRRRTFISRYGKPRATRATGNEIRNEQSRTTTCKSGHKHPTVGEARCCDMLTFLQDHGQIRGLTRYTRHTHYGGASGMACDPCSDEPARAGLKRLRGVIPDFQFEEKQNDGTWLLVTADFKGWLDTGSAQFVAYEIFEAVHGRKIRLYTAKDVR